METLHLTTEKNITDRIDHRHGEIMHALMVKRLQDDKHKEDLILQHIKIRSLEERHEQIESAHAKTFNWIFQEFEMPEVDIFALRSRDEPPFTFSDLSKWVPKPRSLSGDFRDTVGWDSFSDWLEGKPKPESLYWISGKAGSGKSTLMKYLYDDPRTKAKLSQWADGQQLTMASFFFWISGTAEQCSQTGLLRSLLYTLLDQRRHLIQEVFPDLWETVTLNVSATLRSWSLTYASKAFKDLMGCDLGKVALFIDGLDEYYGDHKNHLSPEGERPEYYREILDLLKSLSSSHIKICVSSRPLATFNANFDSRPKLQLQDLTSKDIFIYVRDGLMAAGPLNLTAWELATLILKVVKRAEGVFLWVVLVVRTLRNQIENGDMIKHLEAELNSCPKDLTELYHRMLIHVKPSYRVEGYKIFAMAKAALLTSERNEEFCLSCGLSEELAMVDIWIGLQQPALVSQRLVSLPAIKIEAKAMQTVNNLLRTRCAGRLDAQPENENVLLHEAGNRIVGYHRRSARDFLELATTKSLLGQMRPEDFNVRATLLWSAIQQMRLLDKDCKDIEQGHKKLDMSPIFLTLTAMFRAQDLLLKEGSACVQLLEQLDVAISQMSPAYRNHCLSGAMLLTDEFMMQNNSKTNNFGMADIKTLASLFFDNFLSLAIVFNLADYVESEIRKDLTKIKRKQGRPYLDYALTRGKKYSNLFREPNRRLVEVLLEAGANPNQHCLTTHSVPEHCDKTKSEEPESRLKSWTPWQSALLSLLHASIAYMDQIYLTLHQWQDWLSIFRSLLIHGADVRVKTMYLMESHTVRDIINLVFTKDFPEEARELLTLVDESERSLNSRPPRLLIATWLIQTLISRFITIIVIGLARI